jgi:hypothetical protein
MRRIGWTAVLACCALSGCASPAFVIPQPNPAFVPIADSERLWNTLVDVVDDSYTIDREERVRLVYDPQAGQNTLTEGRIDTHFELSAGWLEPWRNDTVTFYDKLESTLQSMRRKAEIHVVAVSGGFTVEVNVFKDLEDVPRPLYSTAAAGTLRYDTSQRHTKTIVTEQPVVTGWIPQGHDPAAEQFIINQLMSRLGILPPAWRRMPAFYRPPPTPELSGP